MKVLVSPITFCVVLMRSLNIIESGGSPIQEGEEY